MDTPGEITNKVAQSGLVTISPEDFFIKGERAAIDIKELLFQGLVLREKDLREYVANTDWSTFRNKYVAIHCSADAIIPMWAYMLLASALEPFAKQVYCSSPAEMESMLFAGALDALNTEAYRDKRIVIKGCADLPVPPQVYAGLVARLQPVAKSIMYGEPCSTVPVYKKK